MEKLREGSRASSIFPTLLPLTRSICTFDSLDMMNKSINISSSAASEVGTQRLKLYVTTLELEYFFFEYFQATALHALQDMFVRISVPVLHLVRASASSVLVHLFVHLDYRPWRKFNVSVLCNSWLSSSRYRAPAPCRTRVSHTVI